MATYPTLGKYQILEEIGRGGMGAVYKGYDPSLDRAVAIKLLAPHLVWEKAFLERFMREARAAARLDHPNVIHIYDVGQDGNNYYFVMAYLPGPSLKDFISQRGRLAPAVALPILRQLAAALDYAHNKRLIHRDVKPANVMFNEHGQVVLMDFGIVKAVEESRLTSKGTSIGTPQYMAPEQIQGPEVDARTDQYALGIIAFEMLTGRVPFDADTTTVILYKQVNEPPPSATACCPDLPPTVEPALNRALAKSPAERYASCGDFVGALAQALGQPAVQRPVAPSPIATRPAQPPAPVLGATRQPVHAAPPVVTSSSRSVRGPRLALLIGAALVALLVALSAIAGVWRNATGRRTSTPTPLVEATQLAVSEPTTPTLASTNTVEPTVVPTIAPLPTSTPFGGGKRIAFVSSRDGNEEIYGMNIDGTDLTNLTHSPANDSIPAWSPDGKRIAFESNRDGNWEIYTMNYDGSGQTRLTSNSFEDHDPDWSPDGMHIVFHSNRTDGVFRIWVMNADGSGQTPLTLTKGSTIDWAGSWSPDGKCIAYASLVNGKGQIFVMNVDGSDRVNLTNHPSHNSVPHWSPDGTRIVFYSERDGNREVYVMNAAGSQVIRLTNHRATDYLATWSPDGKHLVFTSERDGNPDIYMMNPDGTDVTHLVSHSGDDFNPVWSPK